MTTLELVQALLLTGDGEVYFDHEYGINVVPRAKPTPAHRELLKVRADRGVRYHEVLGCFFIEALKDPKSKR